MMFEVMACNDAHLELMEVPGNMTSDNYEIVLAGYGGKKSAIREGRSQKSVVLVDTPDLLNCNESRQFWVGWKDGYINVGRGRRYGQESFMSWQDPNPHPVNAISLATGWGSTATWKFSRSPGKYVCINTKL